MRTTPEQLFADRLAAEPGRPFVTYYDEGSGDRAELSAASLANWVAKTHHLLVDELGLGAGDRARLALPAHWITLAPLLGALTAGLTLVGPDEDADVAFVAALTLADAGDAPDVFAIAPESARVGCGDAVPPGTSDYVTAVRPHEDKWPGVRFGAGPDDPALSAGTGATGGWTRAELADRAHARASELGLAAGARVLTTRDWSAADDLLDTVFAPLAVGGSLVLVRNCSDPRVLDRRVAQERVTHRA